MNYQPVAIRSLLRSAAMLAAGIAVGSIALTAHAQTAPGPMTSPTPVVPGQLTPSAPSQPQALGLNDPRNPLHLTPDQQRKWIATQMKYQPQAQAILQSASLKPDQKRAQFESLSKKVDVELNAILTPSQRALKQKLMARQAKLQQEVGSRNAQIQKMGAQLNGSLTADQKKRLGALSAKMKPQVEKLMADKSLTPQQKQAKINILGQSYIKARDQILTPSQRALMLKIQKLQTTPLNVSTAQ
ncbi:MAG TPA: hypothetical protein VE986_08490 [Hyphomicrobiales bacterium]|nr:hypothetical protein [Hyphomicrobiales bacterium]